MALSCLTASAQFGAPRENPKVASVTENVTEDFKPATSNQDNKQDGRDIGTVVLPSADVKIFLTASPECRAKRRFIELSEKGDNTPYEEILKTVIERDYNDSHRAIAPLKKADDAIEIDTTPIGLQESIELIYNTILQQVEKKG